MCRVLVLEFFIDNVNVEEFKGKRVLEVGSKYLNGSVRPFIESFLGPKEYIGVDVEPGKFVDIVIPVEKLSDYFGPESFDVVISTETIEHVRDWRTAINTMKGMLRPNGYIFITTVGRGFPYHGYPNDFWRYELDDMRKIFSDFDVLVLKRDIECGTLLKAKKPSIWKPRDLSNIALYSMLTGGRTANIPDITDMASSRRLALRVLNSDYGLLLPGTILEFLIKRFAT